MDLLQQDPLNIATGSHLVFGASGQVGSYLLRAVTEAGLPSAGTYNSFALPGLVQVDVRDRENVDTLINTVRPSVVYLPAAMGNAEYCQLHPPESYAINVVGLANVVRAANSVGAKVVYFSSDYIFDGQDGPYREDDLPNPINVYGQQKVMAEHHLALHAPHSLIIRTTVVYGWENQGKNFIQRLCDTLGAGKTLSAPIDQVGSPTYSGDLARIVLELVQAGKSGVYNVVGSDVENRYEFAREAARVFGLDPSLVQAVDTPSLKQVAPRPLRAGMLVDKVSSVISKPPLGYREGLRLMAAEKQKGEQ